MALQVVQALEELHGQNIMHLALKPSNISMDSVQHEVVLSDFATCHQLQTLPSMPSAVLNVPIQYMYVTFSIKCSFPLTCVPC